MQYCILKTIQFDVIYCLRHRLHFLILGLYIHTRFHMSLIQLLVVGSSCQCYNILLLSISSYKATQRTFISYHNQLMNVNTSSSSIRCWFVMSCVKIYSCYHSYRIGMYKQARNHFKRYILDDINEMRHSGITSQLYLRVVRAIARFRCDNTKVALR